MDSERPNPSSHLNTIFIARYRKLGTKHPKVITKQNKADWLCDSGARICVGEVKPAQQFGICESDLLPSSLNIPSVDNSKMEIILWFYLISKREKNK